MTTDTRNLHYSLPARLLHWVSALCVLAVIPLGFVMMNLASGPLQDQLFDLHRSFGFLILCLSVLRVFTRVVKGAPPPPADIPRWQVKLSTGVHHLLYVLIFVMPLLGWGASSAFGAKVSVFGLFTLPDIAPKNDALSNALGTAHSLLGFLMTALVLLHMGGALLHAVKGDSVLPRMLPSWTKRAA